MARTFTDDYLMHSYSLFDVDWNAIETKSSVSSNGFSFTINSFDNPARTRLKTSNERTIIASLYNRIATDAASVTMKHVRTNQNGRYQEDIDSGLNKCLNVEANIDQTGRELMFDAILSMFDEGIIAIVPTETNVSMKNANSFDILSMRTAKILSWKPDSVQVQIYNDSIGSETTLWLPKKEVAIIQNPFYGVMNQQGSVAKRLIAKLNQSDVIDDKNANAKMDLLLQVPYNMKSPALKKRGEERVTDLRDQLQSSEYGIGIVDGTEKVIQLNRSLENNLMPHVEWLTTMLYSQLGVSKSIFDGTATEQENLNYQNQTIEPILSAFANEFKRKFLSKTARSQHQDIMFFRDPFRIVPMEEIAEIGDKFIRNEILSSNEVRGIVGFKPSEEDKADKLRNPNMPDTSEDMYEEGSLGMDASEIDNILSELDEMEEQLNDEEMTHYASKYYDPVKAHEYYERTKQLKGDRTSTPAMNDTGKEAMEYVKKEIDSERNQKVSEIRTSMKNQIKQLKSMINSLSPTQTRRKKLLQIQISSLKSIFQKEKAKLDSEYSKKYKDELASIREETSFHKETKKSKK